jgi:hypothetical protein
MGFAIQLGLLGVMFAAGMAFGQEVGGGGANLMDRNQKARPTNTFGSTETYYRISFSQFTVNNGIHYTDNGTGGWAGAFARYTTNGDFRMVSALQLPAGAMIDYVELDSCEFNATISTDMTMYDCNYRGDSCNVIPGTGVTAPINVGACTSTSATITPYGPIDNYYREYIVEVVTPAGDGSESLSGVIIGYHIQVSPPPPSATFLDVPTTSPIFRFVEALVASGITAGCDATHYCPASPLTRGQMAVYLATALGLSWN